MNCHRILLFAFATIISLFVFGCGGDSETPFEVEVKEDPADRVPELNIYAVADPTTEVTAVIESDVAEKLVILSEKDLLGIPTKLTGFSFIDAAGKAFSVRMNDEGLPEYIAVGDCIFRLHNYTTSTVDVIVCNEAGVWFQAHEVALDPAAVEYLRNFVFSGFPGTASGDLQVDALNPEDALGFWGDVKNYTKKAVDVGHEGMRYASDAAEKLARESEQGAKEAAAIAADTAFETAKRLGKFLESEVNTIGPVVLDFANSAFGQYVKPILSDIADFFNDFIPKTLMSMTVRLTWPVFTEDLNIHLWTPTILGSSYHVHSSEESSLWDDILGSMIAPPFAKIDWNVRGWRNLSIKQFRAGTYYVSVQHTSGPGFITASGAKIEVTPSSGSPQTFQVPTGASNPNAWWNVLSINGSTGEVTEINTITDDRPH